MYRETIQKPKERHKRNTRRLYRNSYRNQQRNRNHKLMAKKTDLRNPKSKTEKTAEQPRKEALQNN